MIIINVNSRSCAKRDVVIGFILSLILSESTKPEVNDEWKGEHSLMILMGLGAVTIHY